MWKETNRKLFIIREVLCDTAESEQFYMTPRSQSRLFYTAESEQFFLSRPLVAFSGIVSQ